MFRKKDRKKSSTSLLPTYGSGRAEEQGVEDDAAAAMYWANEQQRTGEGWDQQDELDYNKLAEQREEQRIEQLMQNDLTVTHTVKFLGQLGQMQDNRPIDDERQDMLEVIDKAQRQGRLPWTALDEDLRIITLSKYGMKVMDENGEQVLVRHPLFRISNLVYYEDRYGHHMIGLKIGDRNTDKYDLYVYEARNEHQAMDMCVLLANAFESVYENWKRSSNTAD